MRFIFVVLITLIYASVPAFADYSGPFSPTGPLPPGGNVIGNVGIDQSTGGVSNGVQLVDDQYLYGTCSSACASTVLIGPIDTTGFATIHVEIKYAGSGTLNWQTSDEPICVSATGWQGVVQANATYNDIATRNFANLSFFGTFDVPVEGRCMRLWFTTYTSGTFEAHANLRSFRTNVNIGSPVSVVPTPGNGIQVTASAQGTTGAISASLPAVSNKTNYVCGFTVSSAGTSSPAAQTITLSGTISGSMYYVYYPLAAGNVLKEEFSTCIAGSTTNTAIQVALTAPGTGTVSAINIHGFTN